jgi:hypothetical protein
LPALNDRFAKHTMGFFKTHGIGMMGFWTDEIGTSNKLSYILTFDSLADREAKWSAFQADPGWNKVRAETEAEGPIVAQVLNSFMRLTPYSPQPSMSSNLQELRIYDAIPVSCLTYTIASPITRLGYSKNTASKTLPIGSTRLAPATG